jgi:hypothetical protein
MATLDVLVELRGEVSHPGEQRVRGVRLETAERRVADVSREVADEARSPGRTLPLQMAPPSPASRRVPMRQGMVLPQAWSPR